MLDAKVRELEEKLAKAKAKLEAYQHKMRTDPSFAASEIAKHIREDQKRALGANRILANGTNGQLHWFQSTWGEIRRKDLKLVDIENPFGGVRQLYQAQCATTACVAGTGTTLAGYAMVLTKAELSEAESYSMSYNESQQDDFVVTASQCLLEDGSTKEISKVAKQLLRLDYQQADYLFSAERSEGQVLSILDEIASGNYQWVRNW